MRLRSTILLLIVVFAAGIFIGVMLTTGHRNDSEQKGPVRLDRVDSPPGTGNKSQVSRQNVVPPETPSPKVAKAFPSPSATTNKASEQPKPVGFIDDKTAKLGRPLDGLEYLRERSKFRPEYLEYIIKDPHFNPDGVKLSEEQRGTLKRILEEADISISKLSNVRNTLEKKYALTQAEIGSLEPLILSENKISPSGFVSRKPPANSPSEMVLMVSRNGNSGVVRFYPGLFPERDNLLWQECQAMSLAEWKVIRFFYGMKR